mmetsp:Transcript_22880/g.62066  ORF Transcript_22880/g.62066 Transcript_22880/m.62066 type:complete len:286 (+) Transcript_22880:120-977(+)
MVWRLHDSPSCHDRAVSILTALLGVDRTTAEQAFACFAGAVEDESMTHCLDTWADELESALLACGVVSDDREMIEEIISRWRKVGVVNEESMRRKVLQPGAEVLAVLAEDDAWHEATVERVHDDGDVVTYMVVFHDFAKPQEVAVDQVVDLRDVVEDDDGEEGDKWEGECEMCSRCMSLTFHHLIPKETHGKYVNKALPPGVDGEPTRIFLNTHGMMVCRPCHTHIHSLAPNDVLAETLNTAKRVLSHPSVQKFVDYNSKQRVTPRIRNAAGGNKPARSFDARSR